MFPIYICEDNLIQLSHFEKIIKNYILIEELDMDVVCASSDPKEILKVQEKFCAPGLYFLDIELNSDMDGFALAEKIRKKIHVDLLYSLPRIVSLFIFHLKSR